LKCRQLGTPQRQAHDGNAERSIKIRRALALVRATPKRARDQSRSASTRWVKLPNGARRKSKRATSKPRVKVNERSFTRPDRNSSTRRCTITSASASACGEARPSSSCLYHDLGADLISTKSLVDPFMNPHGMQLQSPFQSPPSREE
jgi:hypothetical protein